MKNAFPLAFALLAGLAIFACGSRQSSLTPEQQAEINQRAQFPDNMKPQSTWRFDFENLPLGQLPTGWSQYFTGDGGTNWKVTTDGGNPVLAQLQSENPTAHFNTVVNDSISAKDMVLRVRLKGTQGSHDRGGGFVWRFIDKDNHYIVRANPLEDNVVLYKMENGKRSDLPLVGLGKTYGMDVPKLGDGWNDLRLTVRGDMFTVVLNDKELFKVQDGTLPNTGKVGLWTKADAVTQFDDFEIDKYE
ncbi:MAG: DUF1080 domain-containing protein [Saprospiraceae bacterium]|jgi:hypothetical protein|nr:DUF1080 domain-containing protein [Saprospiraceae bacterium]